jgi:hypothetical protein
MKYRIQAIFYLQNRAQLRKINCGSNNSCHFYVMAHSIGSPVLTHQTVGRRFMQSPFRAGATPLYTKGARLLAVVLTAAFFAAPFARAADELPPDREEIIVTHSRLGPLSEWAQMQQHTAEYNRLKEKFDPSPSSASHYDKYTSDRAFAGSRAAGDDFTQESAEAPTPAAVQAIEDQIKP